MKNSPINAGVKKVAKASSKTNIKNILKSKNMQITNNPQAEVKTVANATPEIINTVNNTSNEDIMNAENIQTEAAQVAAEEQQMPGVVEAAEIVNTVNNTPKQVCSLDEVVPVNVKKIYSLKALEDQAGIMIATAAANRKVYDSQLKKLFRDISGKKEHVFRNHIILCSLKEVLEKNPNFKSYDLDGRLLTIHTPAIELYKLVIDGQHRIVCCKQHPEYELDCLAEFVEGCTDPIAYIKDLNTMNKNWCGEDLKRSMVESGESKNKLYNEGEKLAVKFNLTQKTAEAYLTFKHDASRMADLRIGRDTTIYNEENGQRGKMICAAVQKTFKNNKVGRKLQMLDAIIQAYQSISDSQHATFTIRMVAFLLSLTQEEVNFLHENLNNCNYGQVTDFIVSHFQAFQDAADKGEMDTLIGEKEEEINLFMNKEPEEKDAVKRLKCGTPAQMLQNGIELKNMMEAKQRKANTGSSFVNSQEDGEVEKAEEDGKDIVEDTPSEAITTPETAETEPQPAAIPVTNPNPEEEWK